MTKDNMVERVALIEAYFAWVREEGEAIAVIEAVGKYLAATMHGSDSGVTEAMIEAGQLAIARLALNTTEALDPRKLVEAVYLAMSSTSHLMEKDQ